MRVCLVYDCLFPHTVGGAERWYRNLAERLAADGHEVTYLTLRQWPRGADPGVPGVRVVAVGPRLGLYTASGRRRIGPPLAFGLGVLRSSGAVRRALRRRPHGLVPLLQPARGGRAAAPGALSPGGRLARAVDARVLARLPRRRGRLGRLARAAGVRAHPAARVTAAAALPDRFLRPALAASPSRAICSSSTMAAVRSTSRTPGSSRCRSTARTWSTAWDVAHWSGVVVRAACATTGSTTSLARSSAPAVARRYRRAAFDDVGLFDEAFFAQMEDVEWGFRARLLGYGCRYVRARAPTTWARRRCAARGARIRGSGGCRRATASGCG